MIRRPALVPAVLVFCMIAVPVRASDVLVNGNFDADPLGTGWVQDDGGSGYAPIVRGSELPAGVTPHSSPNAVWLGGLFDVTQRIYQHVDVPSETTRLRIAGQLWIVSEETGGNFDFLYAEIRTVDGTLLETLGQWSNDDKGASWTAFELDATGTYAGQTIRVQFRSTNDATLNTNFFLDTSALDAMTPVDVHSTPGLRITRLGAAMPNPTREGVRLRLDSAARTHVRAAIYDVTGRLVRRIADAVLEPGTHVLEWDGKNLFGVPASAGLYFCRVEAGGRLLSQPINRVH